MSRCFSSIIAFLLLCFLVRESWEKPRNLSCRRSGDCRRNRGEVCCEGFCNTTCPGKYCRWSHQCGREEKCCGNVCKKTCEGSPCYQHRHCRDRTTPLKCCNNICKKDSCLTSACNPNYPAYQTCGRHEGRRLQCCDGTCDLSCLDKPCNENRDCGGAGRIRMKCCDGVCKTNCLGSPCLERADCHGLECCGYFDNKTCARTCRNHKCSLNEECRDRRQRLFCCGDETCRPHCIGSICYSDSYQLDCGGPQTLYCCGIGQKKCRYRCLNVPCKTTEDCGRSYYYCGSPDSRNNSVCISNYSGYTLVFNDVIMP